MPKRVDRNQPEIVAALRAAGCTVQHLHMVGKGCPDIVVGHNGKNFMLELKVSGGQLTTSEKEWHRNWKGQVATVYSVRQALAAVGVEEIGYGVMS